MNNVERNGLWWHEAHALHDEAHHQAHRPLDLCVPLRFDMDQDDSQEPPDTGPAQDAIENALAAARAIDALWDIAKTGEGE